MDTTSSNPASLSRRAFRRYPSKVGAVCGSSARTDLCGGRSAMIVPTATEIIPQSAASEFGGYFVCHRSPVTDRLKQGRPEIVFSVILPCVEPDRVKSFPSQ